MLLAISARILSCDVYKVTLIVTFRSMVRISGVASQLGGATRGRYPFPGDAVNTSV